MLPGKSFLCSKFDVDRVDEALAVEERADRDLDSDDPLLELEDLDLVREGLLVGLEHADDVLAVLLVADEEPPLDVLRAPDGLMTYRVGFSWTYVIASSKLSKSLVRDDRDAGLLELLLPERAVVLEPVRVGRAADDRLALLCAAPRPSRPVRACRRRRSRRPSRRPFPSRRSSGTKPSAMSFSCSSPMKYRTSWPSFDDLPGDVSDEAGQRDEEELALCFHESGGILPVQTPRRRNGELSRAINDPGRFGRRPSSMRSKSRSCCGSTLQAGAFAHGAVRASRAMSFGCPVEQCAGKVENLGRHRENNGDDPTRQVVDPAAILPAVEGPVPVEDLLAGAPPHPRPPRPRLQRRARAGRGFPPCAGAERPPRTSGC